MIFTLFAFFVVLGLLIFVHELGHFMAARSLGVKAEEFGFGFPPRILGLVFNQKLKKWEWVRGNKEIKRKNTIYSLNWIPLGGFVKILGESDEDSSRKKDPANFLHQSISGRIFILSAGVLMNFIFAAFILSLGFYTGIPEEITDEATNQEGARVVINGVSPNSPAANTGLLVGDILVKVSSKGNSLEVSKVNPVIEFLKSHKGEEVLLEIKRGDDVYRLKGVPRVNPPQGEGGLGISLVRTAVVSHPFWESVRFGCLAVWETTRLMISSLYNLLADSLAGKKVTAGLAGPIGIVVLTNQAAEMGLPYLIHFAAILSINLAIINIFPFPALDGGRILFLILEKIKGRPVSLKTEQRFHLTGFYLLIALMLYITVKDVLRFEGKFQVIWEKLMGLF
jgi:regulator of sigma E protease